MFDKTEYTLYVTSTMPKYNDNDIKFKTKYWSKLHHFFQGGRAREPENYALKRLDSTAITTNTEAGQNSCNDNLSLRAGQRGRFPQYGKGKERESKDQLSYEGPLYRCVKWVLQALRSPRMSNEKDIRRRDWDPC